MNDRLKLTMTACLFFFLVAAGGQARAQDASQPAPDNTKMNARDKSTSTPTADQQKDNRSDLAITKQIRESVIKDKTLSTYAHNVKIVSQNGMVTLRGPVRSNEEKRTVEAAAAAIVGQDKVTSQLEVQPKQ